MQKYYIKNSNLGYLVYLKKGNKLNQGSQNITNQIQIKNNIYGYVSSPEYGIGVLDWPVILKSKHKINKLANIVNGKVYNLKG